MANGARMEGIEANLFFTFFGLDAIRKDRYENIKVATVGNPGMHMPTWLGALPGFSALATRMMKRQMEKIDIPPIPEFIELVADSGAAPLRLQGDRRHVRPRRRTTSSPRSRTSSPSASSTRRPPAARSSSPRTLLKGGAMGTHAFGRHTERHVGVRLGLSPHWAWLAGGFVLAFAVPFLFADLLEINRDLFYGLYAVAVFGLIGLWARSTGYDLVAAVKRRWMWAVGLGVVFAGVMASMVLRTEDATPGRTASSWSGPCSGAASSTASPTAYSCRCSRSSSSSPPSREADSTVASPASS